MQFSVRLPLVVALSLLLLSLLGCGEKTVVASGSTKSEQSQVCIDCHQSVANTITGKLIVDEWKLSHHNSSNAAGCADCHEPEQGHPTGCNLCHGGTPVGSLNHVSKNPDEDNKCGKCHGSANGLFPKGSRRAHYGDPNASVRYAGFAGYTASYISTNYIGKCRKCHNPHDPTSNIEYNRNWAKSGHGDVVAGSRRSRDFKLSGTSEAANLTFGTVCVRCHTTTGFINFVSSNFVNVKPFGSTDKTKEVTGCDACHSDYSFKMRAVPRVTIYYNFSGATLVSPGNLSGHAKIQNNGVTFPDFGTSNMCIPCHAGRGIGSEIDTLRDVIKVDFTKINSPGSHDFSGAALLTAKSGYEFKDEFGVKKEYETGVGSITGHDTTGLSTGKGPCITCHMNKATKSDSHTFKPVVHGSAFPLYISNRLWSQVYSVGSDSQAALQISSISSLSCNTSSCHAGALPALTANALNSDKEGFISALAVLNKWLRLVRSVPANIVYPLPDPVYTKNPITGAETLTYSNTRSTTKWDYLGAGTGADLMGAAFNHSTLINEPGAYVHNPLYAKRLIYDSIEFLATNASKLTNPLRYPNDVSSQLVSVADAINYLTHTTAKTLEAGPLYIDTTQTQPVTTTRTTLIEVTATITQQQADAAIKWLYGSSEPSDKSKRPGDN